jgi:hypothetical protein
MEWYLPQSLRKNRTFSGGKIMITICWDCEGVLVVDEMPRGGQQDADRSRKRFK